MSEYREQALARLDGRTLSRVGGGLQLVTVCLTDEGAGGFSDEHGWPLPPTLPVLAHLRPDEARELRAWTCRAGARPGSLEIGAQQR